MAKLILHLGVEVCDDGTVRMQPSSWSFVRSADQRGPLDPAEISGAIAKAIGEQRPVELGESLVPFDTTAHLQRGGATFMNGTKPPAPNGQSPRTVASRIVEAGWLQLDEVEALIKQHGVSRVKDVADWIARKISKGEPVQSPAALLKSLLARKAVNS